MGNVLVTVSGTIDADIDLKIARGLRPRADYLEMAKQFDADLLDYAEARRLTGWFGSFLDRIGGPNLVLAWASFRQSERYAVILTDGEQVGIPLAWLFRVIGRRMSRHLMITHVLSVGKKMLLLDLFRLVGHIDRFIVYSTWQKQFIQRRWGVEDARVNLSPFMVDSDFFAPNRVIAAPRKMICTVGLEFRDYPTLIRAVRDLDVEVVIAAASPWSKRRDTTQAEALPANVTVSRFSQYDLRQLYADCRFVVVPLFDVNFQAGVTTILEAMAMAKAVICTRTPGQTDVIEDHVTGLYVPPGDADALRDAIQYLLDNPEIARAMGEAGRRKIEREMNLDCYTRRLQEYVEAAAAA